MYIYERCSCEVIDVFYESMMMHPVTRDGSIHNYSFTYFHTHITFYQFCLYIS